LLSGVYTNKMEWNGTLVSGWPVKLERSAATRTRGRGSGRVWNKNSVWNRHRLGLWNRHRLGL